MHAERQLIRLTTYKDALRRRIARRRVHCAEAVAGVTRPLKWLDRVVAFGRKLSPVALLAALPLGALIQRAASPPLKTLGLIARWGPLVFSAVRGIKAAVGQARAARR